jgi:hypothetical protein
MTAQEILSHPDKLLAIIGGAAVGGVGVGLLVFVIVRAMTGRYLPRWALMTLMVISGLVSGWLVALWVFGVGGTGLGGPGGTGIGGTPGSDKTVNVATDKDTVPQPDDWARDVSTLYVEVLGEDTLKKIDKKNFDEERRYRIRTEKKTQLLKREEVVDFVKKRLEKEPTLKAVTLVLYKDGPAAGTDWVDKLKEEVGVFTIPNSKQRLAVSAPPATTDAPVLKPSPP